MSQVKSLQREQREHTAKVRQFRQTVKDLQLSILLSQRGGLDGVETEARQITKLAEQVTKLAGVKVEAAS